MPKKAVSKDELKEVNGGVSFFGSKDEPKVMRKDQREDVIGQALVTATGSNPTTDVWTKILKALGLQK